MRHGSGCCNQAMAPPYGIVRSGVSDETLADSLKEILSIGTRPFHEPRIVAVRDCHLLKYKVHSNLRSVSSLYKHSDTLFESGVSVPFYFVLCRRNASFGLALVVAKLPSGYAVVSTPGFLSGK